MITKGHLCGGDDRVEIFGPTAQLLVKLYLSPDGKKIRIVLPELKNMAQSKIDMDHGLIDFTRDARRAQEELKR